MLPNSAFHTALSRWLVDPLAIEFKIPIGLEELSKLSPGILLVMVVVGVALGLAWLYLKVKKGRGAD